MHTGSRLPEKGIIDPDTALVLEEGCLSPISTNTCTSERLCVNSGSRCVSKSFVKICAAASFNEPGKHGSVCRSCAGDRAEATTRAASRGAALHHAMMSWRRLLDRQENTRGTCKSSLIPARLRALSEAIRLPAVPFGHKLFLLFEATISHRRGAAPSSEYDAASLGPVSGFSGGETNTHVLPGNKHPRQQHAHLPEAPTGCSKKSDGFNAGERIQSESTALGADGQDLLHRVESHG